MLRHMLAPLMTVVMRTPDRRMKHGSGPSKQTDARLSGRCPSGRRSPESAAPQATSAWSPQRPALRLDGTTAPLTVATSLLHSKDRLVPPMSRRSGATCRPRRSRTSSAREQAGTVRPCGARIALPACKNAQGRFSTPFLTSLTQQDRRARSGTREAALRSRQAGQCSGGKPGRAPSPSGPRFPSRGVLGRSPQHAVPGGEVGDRGRSQDRADMGQPGQRRLPAPRYPMRSRPGREFTDGHRAKTVITDAGPVEITVPRDQLTTKIELHRC